jgi:predicted nucleic acid-binding protein
VPTSPTPSRVVVLDANVLFPLSLRDLLFRALEKGLYRLQISRHIWDEVIRNLVENGRMTPEGAAYLHMRVQEFLAENDALVSGYEAHIPTLANDPKDRHVLAAAIHAHAAVIVTFNLKDFPADVLAPYGIVAEHPDVFLSHLHRENADVLVAIVREQAAGLRNPPLTVDDVLNTLARHVPGFVSLVRPALLDST